MFDSKNIDILADLAALRQRVGALEARTYGSIDDASGPQPLFDIYAHLLLDGITPGPEIAAMLRSCVLLLSPRNLLDLGRMTGDPFPWRGFLAAIDLLQVLGHNMEEQTAHLEGVVTELLAAQGLHMLRIEDLVRSPVGPVQNLKRFALSRR